MASESKTPQGESGRLGSQVDMEDIPLVIPANKLDADQYSAEDLDGVTESIFGSGNMNFLGMQASQTNNLIASADPFSNFSSDYTGGHGGIPTDGAGAATGELYNLYESSNSLNERSTGTNTDRLINGGSDTPNGTPLPADGNYTSATVGSVSASTLSSDAGSFGAQGLSLGSGLNGTAGNNGLPAQGADGQNGSSGQDGSNGTNGTDGTSGNGGGDTLIDIDIDLGDILGDTLGDTVNIIDNTLIDLGDTLNNLTVTINDVTNILETLIENISNLDLTEITNTITNITETLTENITTILEEIINVTTNITDNITDIVTNIIGENGLQDLILNLDLSVLDTAGIKLELPLLDPLNGNLDLVADIGKINGIVNEIADGLSDLTGLDVISDALGNLAGTAEGLQNTLDSTTLIVEDLFHGLNDGVNMDDITNALDNLNGVTDGLVQTVDDAVGNILNIAGIDTDGSGLLGQIIEAAEDTLGETVGAVEDIAGNTVEIIEDLLANPQETLEDIVQNPLDAVTEVTELVNDAVGEIADPALDLVDDLVEGIGGGLLGGILGGENDGGSDQDLIAGLDVDVLDTGLLDNLPLDPLDIPLNALEDLTGDLDLGLGGTLDLFGSNETSNDQGDTDITLGLDTDILGTDLLGDQLEIPLDPLEEIVGDIDLDVGAALNALGDQADNLLNDGLGGTGEDTLLGGAGNLLGDIGDGILPGLNGAESPESDLALDTGIDILDETLAGNSLGAVLDPIEEIVGDIDSVLGLNTNLLNNSDTDNAAGDTDIHIDLEVAGIEIPEIDIPLDPVENILGDIDMDIDTAINLLGGADDGESDGESDGGLLDDLGSWTESIIVDGGGLFGDLSGADGSNIADVLPDPVSTIGTGLGALDLEPTGGILKKLGGGLFG